MSGGVHYWAWTVDFRFSEMLSSSSSSPGATTSNHKQTKNYDSAKFPLDHCLPHSYVPWRLHFCCYAYILLYFFHFAQTTQTQTAFSAVPLFATASFPHTREVIFSSYSRLLTFLHIKHGCTSSAAQSGDCDEGNDETLWAAKFPNHSGRVDNFWRTQLLLLPIRANLLELLAECWRNAGKILRTYVRERSGIFS